MNAAAEPTGAVRERAGTRDALLDVAAGLMREAGLAAVTLRAVGERAGVSRTTPYRHFSDKEDLLQAVAARGFTALRSRLADAAAGAPPGERLERMGAAYIAFALQHPALYRLMFGPEVPGRERPDKKAAALATFGLLAEEVAAAQDAGLLREGDPTGLAALLWATGHGLVDLCLAGHVDPDKGMADPAAGLRTLLAALREHD